VPMQLFREPLYNQKPAKAGLGLMSGAVSGAVSGAIHFPVSGRLAEIPE
jgi:hypothetical protein